ncbi:YiiX/YebB-like N1pC/P60 family cysteine hydrolase [Spartinivicinus ruber]|uniref:YiiX/YebB-like N1pC/P60 family cysteine hydrolase n=1 Tax=Spartinivicinus ruber TaxID=2683272 RepID=UPI001E52CE2B|nr:YiiX/YebB-like N1pC/P60 family cysteine hydrolase [Spartinivicinus ruber]
MMAMAEDTLIYYQDNSVEELINIVKNNIKEGDLLFISIKSPLYKQVAKTTNSWVSHVGIALFEDGEWVVAESAVPLSRKTPLRKYIKRTVGTQFSLCRLNQPINEEQLQKIKLGINNRLGILYHLGFNYSSQLQFCSKFVHEVFYEALSVQLGKVETFNELLLSNPNTNLLFWRLWYFGRIPWHRKTVTPYSQLIDEQLHTIVLSE